MLQREGVALEAKMGGSRPLRRGEISLRVVTMKAPSRGAGRRGNESEVRHERRSKFGLGHLAGVGLDLAGSRKAGRTARAVRSGGDLKDLFAKAIEVFARDVNLEQLREVCGGEELSRGSS